MSIITTTTTTSTEKLTMKTKNQFQSIKINKCMYSNSISAEIYIHHISRLLPHNAHTQFGTVLKD